MDYDVRENNAIYEIKNKLLNTFDLICSLLINSIYHSFPREILDSFGVYNSSSTKTCMGKGWRGKGLGQVEEGWDYLALSENRDSLLLFRQYAI